MDLAKRYKNKDGVEMNILQMVKVEPEWAANRIQEGERALSILENIKPNVIPKCSGCRHSFGNYPGGGEKCAHCTRVATDNWEE